MNNFDDIQGFAWFVYSCIFDFYSGVISNE